MTYFHYLLHFNGRTVSPLQYHVNFPQKPSILRRLQAGVCARAAQLGRVVGVGGRGGRRRPQKGPQAPPQALLAAPPAAQLLRVVRERLQQRRGGLQGQKAAWCWTRVRTRWRTAWRASPAPHAAVAAPQGRQRRRPVSFSTSRFIHTWNDKFFEYM